jgi:hypothetical protein
MIRTKLSLLANRFTALLALIAIAGVWLQRIDAPWWAVVLALLGLWVAIQMAVQTLATRLERAHGVGMLVNLSLSGRPGVANANARSGAHGAPAAPLHGVPTATTS